MTGPRVMLVVGEPSGDALGAQLIRALRALRPDIEFEGVAGPAMTHEGLTSLFPISDTSVMGLKEVVPKIPIILRRVREVADRAIATRPDLVVLIDSPDFTHRIARRLKRLAPDIPIVKYVAPQVWASRPWRAKSLAEFVDHLLALLPFEPAFFERYGLPTHFVGHPALERAKPATIADVAAFRARRGIPVDAPILVLLPGSRSNEIRFILPIFLETIRELTNRVAGLRIVLPTVAHVREKVRAAIAGFPAPIELIEDEEEKLLAFRAGTAALAASGTVATELALARCPMVIGYRVGWLTALLARPFLRVRYMTLANLVLDAEAIPEFMQERCTADNLVPPLTTLLTSREVREAQIAAVSPALEKLGQGGDPPSVRAAKAILEIAKERERARIAVG